jgi:hypothetical protein
MYYKWNNVFVFLFDYLRTALNNLARASSNNTTVLQQLTATSLAFMLMVFVATLTTANKKVADALAKEQGKRGDNSGGSFETRCREFNEHAFHRNYFCWTHGHWVS